MEIGLEDVCELGKRFKLQCYIRLRIIWLTMRSAEIEYERLIEL